MLLQQLRLGAQLVRGSGEDHFAFDQDDVAVGDLGDVFPVLVHDHAADAGFADQAADAPDFAGNQRGQAFGGFVQDQHVGVGHQRAAYGQHLLLAARQLLAAVA